MQKQNQQQNLLYRKIKLLGEGSFGKAYLMECTSDGTKCVIKQMDMSQMTEKEKNETIREAKILEALKHPNIVRFREVYKTKAGKLCIVMDYADGGDLSSRITSMKKQRSQFSESQILDWFTQICLAMKHVHDRKIIHRDLKCQNIFLTKDNVIKLGDFGIAKVLSNTREKAKTVIGTPYYLSPEIIESKPYSFKTDIWSLGVVLYELCEHKPPFDGQNMHFLALKIVRGNFSPIQSNYSRDLKNLVSLLLQVDPQKRPSTQQILKLPIITNRIKNFLTESVKQLEFAHTILHNKMIKPDGKISDILFETEVFHNKEQAKQREYFSQQEFQKKEQEKVQLENKLIQKQEKAQEQLKKIMQQKKEEIEKYQQNIVQKRINSAQKYVNLLRKLLTVFLEQYVQDIFLIQSFSNYLFQLNNVLQIEQAQAAEKKQLLQKQNEKKLNYHYQQSPRANKDLNSINDNVNNNVNNNNWFVPQVKPLEKVDKQIDNKQQQQVFFIPAPVKKKAQISAVKAKPKPIIEKAPVIKKAIDQKSQENERIEKDNQRKQEREKMIQDIQRRKLEKQQNEDIHIQWIGGGGVDDTTTTDNTEEEKQVQQMKFRRVRSSQSQEKHEEFKKILADKENLKKMQQAELQKKSLEKMKKIKDEIRQQNELQSMKEQIKMDEDEERINEIIQNIDQKNQEILDFMKNSNKELQIIDDCNFDQENIQQNTGKFEINQGEIKIESEDIDTNKCDESNNIDQQNIAKKRQLSESCEQKCNDESVLDQQLISSDEHQIISHAQMMLELQNLVENMNKEVGNMPENKYEKNLPDNVFDFTQMPPQKNEKLQFQIQDQRQDISDEDSDDLAQEFNKNYTAINQQTQFIIDTQEEDTMFYISDFSKIENLRLLLEENLGADKFISSYKILQEKFDQYSIEEIEKMYGHDNYASLLPQFQQVDLDKYLALLFTLILMEEKMQTFNC